LYTELPSWEPKNLSGLPTPQGCPTRAAFARVGIGLPEFLLQDWLLTASY